MNRKVWEEHRRRYGCASELSIFRCSESRLSVNADLLIFNNCHSDLLWQITVQQIIILQSYS